MAAKPPDWIDFYRAPDCQHVLQAARAAAELAPIEREQDLEEAVEWRQIALPAGLLHPACVASLAEALGWTPLQVLQVARDEAWVADGAPHVPPGHPRTDLGIRLTEWPPGGYPYAASEMPGALARWKTMGLDASVLLGDDQSWQDQPLESLGLAALERLAAPQWFIRWVPVPPAELSPKARRLALRELYRLTRQAKQLVGIGAPGILLAETRRRGQQALERVLVAGSPDHDAFGQQSAQVPPPRTELPAQAGDAGHAVRAAAASGPLLAVGFTHHTTLIGSTGLIASWPSGGLTVVGANEDTVWYWSMRDGSAMYWDCARATWAVQHPESVGMLVWEEREAVFLLEIDTQRRYPVMGVTDRVRGVAYAAGGGYVALCGDDGWQIYGPRGQLLHELPPAEHFPNEMDVLCLDGTTFRVDDPTEWVDGAGFAFGLWDGALRWIQDSSLWCGVRHICVFGFPVHAAAFSPDGQRVAIVTTDRIVWVDADRARILETWPLRRER